MAVFREAEFYFTSSRSSIDIVRRTLTTLYVFLDMYDTQDVDGGQERSGHFQCAAGPVKVA